MADFRLVRAAFLATTALFPVTASLAQTVAADNTAQLPEIVVTAQKRASTVQDTPISITAVGGGEIQDRGITDFATLAGATPGVSLKSNGPGQTELEMRGMTSSGGNSATVGFYLDDIPLTAPASAQNGKVVISPTLYDLNRIEVLRGPQGTLYGSGSMGGTVKLITNQPNLTEYQASAESILSGTQGGGFNHNTNFMANFPLIKDQLALRIVASEAETSGWIDRIVSNQFPLPSDTSAGVGGLRGNVRSAPVQNVVHGTNEEHLYGTRVSLLWKPTSQLTITPSIFYQRTTQNGPSAFDSNPATLAHYQPFDIDEPYSDRIVVYNLTANYSFDDFDLTSITSQWNRNSIQGQDGSENFNNPGSAVEANYPGTIGYYLPGGTGPIYGVETDPSRQFSQEVRVASTGDGPLKWVGGVFYSRYRAVWNLITTVQNPAAFIDLGTLAPATSNTVWSVAAPTTDTQYAVFGEGTYALTDKLKATIGLRWFSYDYTYDETFSGWGSPLGAATPSLTHVSQSQTDVNPKFNLAYEFNKDLLVYGTAAKGFRSGGGNQPLPTTGPLWANVPLSLFHYASNKWPSSYNPDTLWSYEIGEKARFFDRRLTVNASVYYEDWTDVQLLELPNDYPLTDNNGSANIYGAELEVRAALGGGFELNASGGYTRASLTPSKHYTIQPYGKLPDVPPITTDINLTYTRALDDKYVFTARAENTFVDSRYDITFPPGYGTGALTQLPPYDLTNIRAGIQSDDGWGATLFVNNLFNKKAYLENMQQLTLANVSFNRVVTNQPLTAGIDLTYRY
jgi:iron complex outermembrane receptor protein